jgi:hypothetical protein
VVDNVSGSKRPYMYYVSTLNPVHRLQGTG